MTCAPLKKETYDGDGRRVAKVGSKLYWYGSGGDILAETDASGNTTAEYIFFGGKRIATLPSGGSPSYYVEDMLGTSRVLTTNTGVVCYDADFYPYGGERAYTNTCPQNYKFEGKERDAETGNDDFGARYYSNRFGRWLSADWSAVPVPVPYANLTNPQTLNLYSMVADDPESFADLDGHCCSDDDIDYGIGVLKGILSSATFGAVGAPKATDSPASLAGQLTGTGIAGIAGEVIKDAGEGTVTAGLVAELPSGGTSTVAVAAGGAGIVVGQAVEVGAAANVARIAAAGYQRSGFKQQDKATVKEAAGGRCEYCGQDTVKAEKSQKGVTPPKNEAQTDHYDPKGPSDKSNAVHACRGCNREKTNTPPEGTKWELPRMKKPRRQNTGDSN